MSQFLNPDFQALEPYVPGEQPREKIFVKLNTNESPYAPGRRVLEAVNTDAVRDLRLYEDPTNRLLNETLAETFHVSAENVISTCGSDEAINLAIMAFGHDGLAFPDLTYGFYKVYADLNHMAVKIIPLKDDFSIGISEYAHLGRMILIANPNAPTGLYLTSDQIEFILRENPDHVVMVDEAYIKFGSESMIPLIKKYDNLLVTQTFSKSHSLAGARVGYAVGHKDLIADMERIRNSMNPYNISRLSQIAATEALREPEYYDECCRKVIESREWTKDQLTALGFEVTDSRTNFVFAQSHQISGERLYRKLREKGILVRHFNHERIRNYNRISIGTQKDMEFTVNAVKEILNEEKNSTDQQKDC